MQNLEAKRVNANGDNSSVMVVVAGEGWYETTLNDAHSPSESMQCNERPLQRQRVSAGIAFIIASLL